MARRALSAFSRWALEDAYTDLLDFCDSLQRRVSKLVDDVRILRQKYASAKAENMDLIWIRLVGPGRLLGGLPAMDDAVVESDAIMGDYRLGATLGVGSSAVVREGVDERSGERLAIKIVDKSRAARYKIVRRLHNEVVHMRAVEHPNAARSSTPHAGLYRLEHGGRDLYGYVGAAFLNMVVPEPVARHVVSQLVAGCCALSARGVVHHDVKSENVLVAPGVEDGQVAAVRLTDLGMSETYEPGQRGTAFCGSPGFFPPEMVAAADYDPFKVDAWSIGCVALELLLGRQWFSDRWLPASKLTGDPAEFAVALSPALADLAALGRHAAAEAKSFLESALTEDRTTGPPSGAAGTLGLAPPAPAAVSPRARPATSRRRRRPAAARVRSARGRTSRRFAPRRALRRAVAAATPPGDGDDELESSTPSRARAAADASPAPPPRLAVPRDDTDAAAPNAAPEGDVPVDVTVEMEPLRGSCPAAS
ncbi:protein kinase [Aureococcus anophagefferens]|nr:protein kinase [Aureococcus anophagefferens]